MIFKFFRKAERVSMPEELEKKENKKETAIVPEEELNNHLNHGWRFVSVLPSGKILIERVI